MLIVLKVNLIYKVYIINIVRYVIVNNNVFVFKENLGVV